MASLRRHVSLEVRQWKQWTRRCANPSATMKPDAGSPAIDQLTSSFCIGAGSIVREAVKRVHDAYLGLASEQLEGEGLERAVVISRQRDGNGTGHLFIEDNGIGQSFEDLRQNLRMSMSRELQDFKDGSGVRNLCSWTILSAGSKVVIHSTTQGVASRSRLEINVRRIREKMAVATMAHDILSDSECLSLSTEGCGKNDHGTTLEIECDGSTEIVNGYELNCFYDLTDPEDETLRHFLVEGCAIPYSTGGGAGKKIRKVYDRAGYVATAVYVDGRSLERRLPPELTAFHTQDVKVGGKVAAIAWYVEDPKRTGAVGVDAAEHLLSASGIQLVKNNVPVGPKDIFGNSARTNLLKWFVGEIHIVSRDVQPDASGQDLRIGTARDTFIEALRKFYNCLEEQADAKCRRLNTKRDLRCASKPRRL